MINVSHFHKSIYFYYKWIVYIMNKLQIIILYHMNQFTNLYDQILSLNIFLDKYSFFLDKYTYKYIINSSLLVHEHIIMFEFNFFTKFTNIDKFFLKLKWRCS